MAEFSLNDFLDAQGSPLDSSSDPTQAFFADKQQALAQASEEKVRRLDALIAKRAQLDQTWAGSDLSGLGAKLTNTGAKFVSEGARAIGQGLASWDNLQGMGQQLLAGQAATEAYGRLQQGKASPEDLQLLATRPYVPFGENNAQTPAAPNQDNRLVAVPLPDGKMRVLHNYDQQDNPLNPEQAKAYYENTGQFVQDLSAADYAKQAQAQELLQRNAETRQSADFASWPSNYERLVNAEQQRQDARDTVKAFDLSGIVNPEATTAMVDSLGQSYDQAKGHLEQANQAYQEGRTLDGLASSVKGVAQLIGGVGSAVWDNPQGAVETIAGVVGQSAVGLLSKPALVATNVGYALDTLNQGIEAYKKAHDGALPTGADYQKMVAYSASLAAAEQVGDASLLGKLMPGGAKAVSEAAGLFGTAARVADAAITHGGTEALTEGYQTFAEGQITGKPASGKEIYQGAALGAIGGGGLNSGVQLGQDIAASGARREQDQLLQAPQKAALAELGNLFKDTVAKKSDLGAQASNLQRADELLGVLETRRADLVKRLDSASGDSELQATRQQLETMQQRLAATDPKDAETRGNLQQFIDLLQANLTDAQQNGQADQKAARELELLDKNLAVARQMRERMAVEVKPTQAQVDEVIQAVSPSVQPSAEGQAPVSPLVSPEEQQAAADKVITLAMRSPEAFSSEQLTQLVDNPDSVLSEPQRQYLRALSLSRQAENQVKGLAGVNQDILVGNAKQGYRGLNDYRNGFRQAVATQQPAMAQQQLKDLREFARGHVLKAKAAAQALDEAQNSGQPMQLVRDNAGQWQVEPLTLTREQLRANGGLEIRPGSPLPETIAAEAKALTSGLRELQAGYQMAFAPAPAQMQASQPQPAAAAAQPAPASEPASAVVGLPTGEVRQENGPQAPGMTAVPDSVMQPAMSAPAPVEQPAPVAAEALTPPVESGAITPGAPVESGDYRQSNLLTRFFTQQAGKANSASPRPLVAVKDFLSQLGQGTVNLADYLAQGSLQEQQLLVWEHFKELAGQWRPAIEANLHRRDEGQREHFYKDPIQFFFQADGSIDENLATAISYAGFSWLAEKASQGGNSDSQINDILGRDDDSPVSQLARNLLADAGEREKLVVLSLGQRVMDALGLQAKPEAPLNETSRFQQALGSQAMALLVSQGAVERRELTQAQLDEASGNEAADPQRGKQKVFFLRVSREPGSQEANKLATGIYKASVGSQNVLGKLFGAEDGLLEPSFEPIPFTQRLAKRTQQQVPSRQAKALEKVQSTPFFIRQDNWQLWGLLDEATLLDIAGGSEDFTHLQLTHRESARAKSDDLRRQIRNFSDFAGRLPQLSPEGLEQGLYFETSVWKPQRVGIKTNLINPQSSKVHRHMLYLKAWETEVKLDDTASLNDFLLRIGEGFGVKTDKLTNEAALEEVRAKLADPVIRAGVSAIRQALYDQGEGGVSAIAQDRIRRAVKAGGENFHSLDALVGLAHYAEAKASGKPSFTVQLMGEVDGVTNGPMLSLFALGAASFQRLVRGGFFPLGSTEQTTERAYNRWRSQPGHLDLYEETIDAVNRGLQELLTQKPKLNSLLAAIQQITGPLSDNGSVSSDGRKIIKTPLTAMVFGSSVSAAVDNMAEEFVDKVYQRIEGIAKSGDASRLPALLGTVNQLLGWSEVQAPRLDVNLPLERAMESFRLQPAQVRALKQVFRDSVGRQVGKTLREHFAVFIERRRVFNETAQLSFALFDGAYRHYRAQVQQQAAPTVRYRDREQPLHDITQAEDRQIRQRLGKLAPLLHTPLSRASGERAAGLYLAKQDNQMSDALAYSIETKFGQSLDYVDAQGSRRQFSTARLSGMQRQEVGPGVAPLILDTHSTDSAVAIGVYGQMDVLNLHDAGGAGVGMMREMAIALNRSLYEQLSGYSASSEMLEVFERSVSGALELLQQDGDPALAKALESSLLASLPETSVEAWKDSGLGLMEFALQRMTRMAYDAERAKLQLLSELAYVDQYAFEGGAYAVTDKQREQARERLARLSPEVRPELLKRARQLDKKLAAEVPAVSAAVSEPATAGAVQAVTQAESQALDESEKTRLAQVLERMLSQNQAVDSAVKVLPEAERPAVVEAVAAQPVSSPWGELGTPLFPVDAELERALQAKPVMPVGEFMARLKPRLSGASAELLKVVARTVDRSLQIHYVDAQTDPAISASQGVSGYRGWYEVRNGQGKVFLKGSAFRHAGLNAELGLHELVHASLAGTIQRAEQAGKGEAFALVQNLEEIRQRAQAYVQAQHLDGQFAAAVENVQELVAWGMTNADFQQQVLGQISLNQATAKNGLVSAVNRFIQTLIGLLFAGSGLSPQKIHKTGLALLVKNVSGLYKEAAQQRQASEATLTLGMASPGAQAAQASLELGTVEILEALEQYGTPLAAPAKERLVGLLEGIVARLHGPFGSLKVARQQQQALSPQDVYLKTLQSGQAPFASAASAVLPMSEAEAYVAEQVEVTVLAALSREVNTTSLVYDRLQELYREARQRIRPQDFYAGDWALASPTAKADAQAQWDFVFQLQPGIGGKSDYLARFAALGLTWAPLQQLLQAPSEDAPTDRSGLSWFERLRGWFEDVLDALGNKLVHLIPGEPQGQRLLSLVDQLVDIEARRREQLAQRGQGDLGDRIDELLEGATGVVRDRLEALAKLPVFRQSKFGLVRAMSRLPGATAPDRLEFILDGLQRLRDRSFPGRLGIIAGIFNEMRGSGPSTAPLYALLRGTKHLENQRKNIITDVTSLVSESYANGGADLSLADKAALSKVLLRTDAQALLAQYSLAELERLVTQPAELDKAIRAQIDQLQAFGPWRHYYLNAVKDLAYFKATGLVVGPNVMANTYNIAKLVGTSLFGQASEDRVREAVKVLDPLQALLALSYTDFEQRRRAGAVMAIERARTEGNGVELTLKLHRSLQQQSAERLFNQQDSLRLQGFVPEILNPYTDVQTAGGIESDRLVAQGYVRLGQVPVDPHDPDPAPRFLHVRKHGGLQPYLTGVLSYSGDGTRGRKLEDSFAGSRVNRRLQQARLAEINRLFQARPDYEPGKVVQRRLLPVVNAQGQIVSYRYMMSEQNKDRLMERNDSVDRVLGVMAGTLFDKTTAYEQNRRTVEALHEQYLAEYAERPESYLLVGPQSPDAEARDAWFRLPKDTREAVKEIWGDEGMLVRTDVLDLVFGYRKPSLASAFDTEPGKRKAWEKVVVTLGETLFGAKAALRIRQGGDIVETLVNEAKDIVVVKSGLTLLGNMQSNLSQLFLMGVTNPLTIARDHRIALKGALQYRRDNHELTQLQSMREADYLPDGRAALEQRIHELQDAIARNPVKPLIDAGLLPSIVEDVALSDDPYSYRGQVSEWVQRKTEHLPGWLQTAGKTLYMAHDTPLYRFLGQGTQLSDFVARYTLYQHLVNRSRNPLSHEAAVAKVSEAFVNYDIPSHRGVQWLNDTGLILFTRYYLRIQKVLLGAMRDKPARALLLGLLESYYNSLQSVLDSQLFARLGNPLETSVLKFPEALDDLLTVQLGSGLFKGE